jgi:cellulose synthase/poly-beta-1,6-N-acetylglucosamine synthase-like glycosyltransferase
MSPAAGLLPWALFAAPPLIPLAIVLLNALTWTRGRPGAAADPRVSVLVPARDEARTIGANVEAVLGAADGAPQVREMIVCDDGSTDGTGEVLRGLMARFPRLRVIHGRALPPGWVGKPHACHQLVEAAQGEVLLFLDADVRLLPGGLDRLLGELDGVGGGPPADLVTAVPRQQTGSPFEHLMLPLLHLSYAAWLPQALVPRTRDPRVLAANGQVLAVRRAADAAAGGFSAVRGAVVDDMAYCRRVKEAGLRVVFADGHEIARCRMYEDAPGVWAGFSKNMYEGIGGHPLALLFVMALHIGCFVTPYLAVAAGLLGAPALLGPGLAGVGANLLLRAVLGLRHGHRAGWALLHPVAVLAMMGILLNSWRWSVRRDIRWRGRSYPGAAGAAP